MSNSASGTPPPWEQAYPCNLRARERALKPHARVGVALSGGGIRSATFAFGVMQAFAKLKTLKDIDVLSTVSGGGYTGSLISRLYARKEVNGPEDVARLILPERDSSTPNSPTPDSSEADRRLRPGAVLRWLRDNGRYLAPNGDKLLLGAILLRNWLSVQVVLTTLILTLFVFMQLLRTTFHKAFPPLYEPSAPACVAGITSFRALESWLTCYLPLGDSYVWWSPWLLLPALVLVLAIIPFACVYWLESNRPGHDPFVVPILTALSISLPVLLLFFDVPVPRVPMAAFVFAWFVAVLILGYVRNERRFGDRRDPLRIAHLHNWLSQKLKIALVAFGFTLALAVIDTLGQTVYAVWQASESSLGVWLATWSGGLVAAFAGARWFVGRFAGRTSGPRLRLPISISAAAAAVLLFTVTLTAVNALSHGIAWGFEVPHPVPKELLSPPAPSLEESVDRIRAEIENLESSLDTAPNRAEAAMMASSQGCEGQSSPCLALPTLRCTDCAEPGTHNWTFALWAFVFLWLLSLVFGLSWPFLNNSTLLPLYTARLTRAYLGASNPARVDPRREKQRQPLSVTRVHRHDDMYLRWDERPGAPTSDPLTKGAPLHFVNVTINETLEGRSQVELKDRQGIGMAVGPAGISAGVRHHVVFSEESGNAASIFPKCDLFRMFEYKPWVRCTDETSGCCTDKVGGERLSLGQWTAISGAAFSTGLGSRTSLGLSLLAGFFNVRLGYWWDSGVCPSKRSGTETPRSGAGARVERAFARAFPVQSHLLEEFLARFRGVAGRYWCLTDGGHFENLGAYELIRRRLPLIVIVDAEADPDYTYDGLANLIRKARLDFDAEIEFLGQDALCQRRTGGLLSLAQFGTLDMLRRGPWAEEPVPSTDGNTRATRWVFGPPERPKRSLAHAALGEVRYEGRSNPESLIVYLKPTLVGDEPADVVEYHAANQDFPHQTTTDQFFRRSSVGKLSEARTGHRRACFSRRTHAVLRSLARGTRRRATGCGDMTRGRLSTRRCSLTDSEPSHICP